MSVGLKYNVSSLVMVVDEEKREERHFSMLFNLIHYESYLNLSICSLSVQVIQRGTRSAGYGFVSVQDVAQVEKAVTELNKKELDGREIIVEAAKPAEDKEKERTERRTKKRAGGRRGNKAPPGEVTEAEANGEVPEVAPEAATGEPKTKKRTKRAVSRFLAISRLGFILVTSKSHTILDSFS